MPVMGPAAVGNGLTVIGKLAETVPMPQEFTPTTVRFPEVAPAEKVPVMEALLPEGVNPAPL